MPLHIAIVGSGPAGLYCAEKLLRDAPGARIDVIEKLPTPYGLVRAGVAPDHQGTKAVTRVFDRMFRRGDQAIAFWGHVEAGRDVTLAELRSLYDAVVIATGAPLDRRLGIPGEDLPGVVGSGAFVGWYNGQPDWTELAPRLEHVRSAVVIGNGNVAVDVARVLAKTAEEMARSDLDPEIGSHIGRAPLATISIVGRRGAVDAHFSPAELAELSRLARAAPVVSVADLPHDPAADTPTLKVLREFAAAGQPSPDEKPVAIRFLFGRRPAAIVGAPESGVAAIRFERMRLSPEGGGGYVPAGVFEELPADLVVTCIGYGAVPCCTLAPAAGGAFVNEDGRIGDGLYVVGWAKRGPSGTIATNRAEAHAVAQRLLREVAGSGGDRAGRAGLEALLRERGVDVVSWARWERIDAREVEQGAVAGAAAGRLRRKFRTVAAMLDASADIVALERPPAAAPIPAGGASSGRRPA
jgi:ferredoxin--NADP+ reductase